MSRVEVRSARVPAAGADEDADSAAGTAAELAADEASEAGGSAHTADVVSDNIPRHKKPVNLFNDANPHDDPKALHAQPVRIRTGSNVGKIAVTDKIHS
jgi:hypothetical protein